MVDNILRNGTVESVLLTPNNTIEVVRRKPSNSMYASNPPKPVPDSVWKEIYGVVDGKIKLIETINGRHIPGKYQNERFEF